MMSGEQLYASLERGDRHAERTIRNHQSWLEKTYGKRPSYADAIQHYRKFSDELHGLYDSEQQVRIRGFEIQGAYIRAGKPAIQYTDAVTQARKELEADSPVELRAYQNFHNGLAVGSTKTYGEYLVEAARLTQ